LERNFNRVKNSWMLIRTKSGKEGLKKGAEGTSGGPRIIKGKVARKEKARTEGIKVGERKIRS